MTETTEGEKKKDWPDKVLPWVWPLNAFVAGGAGVYFVFGAPGWWARTMAAVAGLSNAFVFGTNLGMRIMRRRLGDQHLAIAITFFCPSCHDRGFETEFNSPQELMHHMELCENR